MARSGSLAAWEQRLAAQRRDEDRLARERRQRERDSERVRQQEHLASRQREAEEQTAAVEEQMKALGEVLASILPLRPLTFERLLATPRVPEFDPGPLGSGLPAPDWDDFAPVAAAGLGRFLGAGARQARLATEARARFEAAQAEHQHQEAERRRALAVAKAKYDRKVTEERAKAAARNAYVTSRQSAFAVGDPQAVQWFVGCVLRVSPYPDGFPREYQVTYDPGNRDVTVDLELPPRSVVPAVRAYRYVKARTPSSRCRARKARSPRLTNGWSPASRCARCTRSSAPSRPSWPRPSRSPAGSARSTGLPAPRCGPACSPCEPSAPFSTP